MKYFFIDDNLVAKFKLFGALHISLIVITILTMVVIVLKRDKIDQLSDKVKNRIRLFIMIFMFLNMTIYYLSKVIFGVYNWKVHLPFHFCFIAGYLFMLALLLKKDSLYKISFFMTFMGPIPAIIWPELYRTLNCFIFYQYFISHHFFLAANLFIYYAYHPTIEKKDFVKTLFALLGIFAFMLIFNFVFDTNYIFSSNFPPHIIKLYPILGTLSSPVILVFITGLLIMGIAYLFPYFRNKELTKKK